MDIASAHVACSEISALHAQGGEQGAACSALLAARESLGLTRLESFPVQHCAHAFGIVMESSSGWKVAVSGDTRPCPAVAEAAQDATILIHEVTQHPNLLAATASRLVLPATASRDYAVVLSREYGMQGRLQWTGIQW